MLAGYLNRVPDSPDYRQSAQGCQGTPTTPLPVREGPEHGKLLSLQKSHYSSPPRARSGEDREGNKETDVPRQSLP